MEMFLEITFNFGMLVSVSIIGGFIIQRVKNRYLQSVFQGFLFGLAAVVGILHPVVVNKGLIFDGRSVMISLAGLFYGPIAAVISATGAGILRVFQGGAGVYMGTAVIVSSAIIGLICHYMWQKEKLTIKKILIMSIDVHIAMLACTVFLPDDIRNSVLSKIWISVLTVYPLSSLLIGKMLLMASDHWRMKKQLARIFHKGRKIWRRRIYL